MNRLESLIPAASAARQRAGYWNNAGPDTFPLPERAPPGMPELARQGSRAGRSRVRVAEICSGPQIVRHSREHVTRTRLHVHFLHLQAEGESLNRQDQREARLGPGDIAICDNSRPYEIVFEHPGRILIFGFPDDLLRRYIQYPQSIAAKGLSGNRGIGGLLSDFLSDVWRHCQDDREFEISAGVTDAILGLLASAYRQLLGSSIDHSSLGAAHRVRVIQYIEEHLGDSNLTPTRIAETFRITTRYLHHLFSEEDETVARYILRRRLEECARALTSQSQRKRTITSIAFDYGFSSATHFGRAFRSRYDLTPREYRHRNLLASRPAT
jgi:AraC-like DNA-binding protein